jgi:hypothetical protein
MVLLVVTKKYNVSEISENGLYTFTQLDAVGTLVPLYHDCFCSCTYQLPLPRSL